MADTLRCFGRKITDPKQACPHPVRWIITMPLGEEKPACSRHKDATDVFKWKARPA